MKENLLAKLIGRQFDLECGAFAENGFDGDFAAVETAELGRHTDKVLRLGAEESGGVDQGLNFGQVSLGERGRVGKAGEEGGCHKVDAGVGALC